MRLAVAVGAVLIVVVVVIGGMWMLQDRLIYFPGPDPGPPPSPWKEVRTTTSDGLELSAWLRVDRPGADRPTVIVFPGNAGNRAGRIPLGNALAAAGYAVILAEYRGYGGNGGRPSESGLIADALAATAAARDLGLSGGGLVYFGESLGAAVAIAAAGAHRPDAVVLGSPFTSLVDVGRHHYPFLPVGALARDHYPSLDRIKAGDLDGVPVLVVAGTADRTVPVGQSRRVAEAAGAEVYEVEGADHNDPSIRSARPMVDAVAEFLGGALDR